MPNDKLLFSVWVETLPNISCKFNILLVVIEFASRGTGVPNCPWVSQLDLKEVRHDIRTTMNKPTPSSSRLFRIKYRIGLEKFYASPFVPFFFIFTNSRVSLLYISISVMSCYRGIALSLPWLQPRGWGWKRRWRSVESIPRLMRVAKGLHTGAIFVAEHCVGCWNGWENKRTKKCL